MKKTLLLLITVFLLMPGYVSAKINWTSGYDRANRTHYWLEEDGTLKPGTTNNVDLGTTELEIKKIYTVDGWACAFVFGDPDIAAGVTWVTPEGVLGDWGLPVIGAGSTDHIRYYTMPFAGNVLSVSAYARTAVTAEYVSFNVTINDVKTGLITDLEVVTDTQADTDTQAGGNDTFTAGQRLGMAVDSGSSFAPTTNDYTVVVIVGFDL